VGDAERRGGRFWGLRVADIIAVCLVLVAAAGTMVVLSGSRSSARGGLAVIEVNGRVVNRIVLGDDAKKTTYRIKGRNGESAVEVQGGKVHMLESACRDKICVGMGWVDRAGQAVVCLPNRVVIRITGSQHGSKVDTVTE
jgi:hypothetical protein